MGADGQLGPVVLSLDLGFAYKLLFGIAREVCLSQ